MASCQLKDKNGSNIIHSFDKNNKNLICLSSRIHLIFYFGCFVSCKTESKGSKAARNKNKLNEMKKTVCKMKSFYINQNAGFR